MATATSAVAIVADMHSIIDALLRFMVIFAGGASTGLVVGLLFGYLQARVKQRVLAGVMSLVVAYGSYLLAEYLMVSGVMSTLVAALSFSAVSHRFGGNADSEQTGTEDKSLWDMLSYVANVSVFLIVGAVITLEMFEQRWLAMLIAIVALLVARAISVYGVLLIFSSINKLKVPLAAQTVMVWGGLRGAVTLALALSLPTSVDYWWTIQSIAFGVVVFSLFVQAPTLQLLVEKLLLKGK